MTNVRPYLVLVSAFVAGRLTGQEFQSLFLFMYQNDGIHHAEDVYATLNEIFYAAEDFCADPALRSAVSLDEAGLRVAITPRREELIRLGEVPDAVIQGTETP